MTDNKKKSNNVQELAAKNLAQIQKIDPCAFKILDKSAHAALYRFNIDNNEWVKTDINGTMFVYQRVDRPLFSLMIANRQSPDDFIEPITPNLKVNLDQSYLFFCKADGTINGLWFYDTAESVRIHKLVVKLIEKLSKNNTEGTTSKQPTSSNNAVVDERSAQLLELIKGGTHKNIEQPTVPKNDEGSTKSDGVSLVVNLSNSDIPSTSSSSKNDVKTMPPLLQKLMIQEQPRALLKEPGTAMSADELEKDLLKTAKPRNCFLKDFVNSPSAVSLAAISTKSVHGSEGDADINDDTNIEQNDTSFVVGSGSNTPVLNKEQFAIAITHLLQHDDRFVAQVHQAYIDAINRRLNLD